MSVHFSYECFNKQDTRPELGPRTVPKPKLKRDRNRDKSLGPEMTGTGTRTNHRDKEITWTQTGPGPVTGPSPGPQTIFAQDSEFIVTSHRTVHSPTSGLILLYLGNIIAKSMAFMNLVFLIFNMRLILKYISTYYWNHCNLVQV